VDQFTGLAALAKAFFVDQYPPADFDLAAFWGLASDTRKNAAQKKSVVCGEERKDDA